MPRCFFQPAAPASVQTLVKGERTCGWGCSSRKSRLEVGCEWGLSGSAYENNKRRADERKIQGNEEEKERRQRNIR